MKVPSITDNKYFGQEFLEAIRDWIVANLPLEERATTEELLEWAKKNIGYINSSGEVQ